MFLWAMRYVLVVLAVGGAFGLLQGSEVLRPESDASARSRADLTEPTLNEHVVRAGPHGHFVLEAVVNGEPMEFLVDTGASHLVLAPKDAERIGFETLRLDFSLRYQTAGGEIRAAPVTLREVRIGQNRLFDVDASVSEAALPISLLGISILDRLGGYRVEGDRLYLYW